MNRTRYTILLACLLVVTGFLGKADLLTTAIAFGYGGGGGGYTTPYVILFSPNGGQALPPGSAYQINWSAGGTGLSAIRLMLSTDSGASFSTVIVASTYNSSFYNWIVPDVATTSARVQIEALGISGSALASDVSNADFAILGTTPPVEQPPVEQPSVEQPPVVQPPGAPSTELTPVEAAAPVEDPTSSGTYNPTVAVTSTPTINVDMDILPRPGVVLLVDPGTLIKGSQPSVYYYGRDGKRYVFPNQWTYLSWYANFGDVTTISDELLASIPMGGNVTYRPGARMVKIQSDPRVYAVSRGGVLRWVQTEAIARALYGARWNRMVDDVSDAFFTNYRLGDPVTLAEAPSIPAPETTPATPTASPVCNTATTFTKLLTVGSVDAEVRPLQALLQCLGYIAADVSLTGYYGTATQAAVREFQADNGLDAFGYVGPGTRAALNRYVAGQ